MARDLRFELSDDDEIPTLGHTRRSVNDGDDDDGAALATNRNADHHTIVDMNLRTARFVVVVALALVVAFTYAFVTSRSVVVARFALAELALVESKVEVYNTILGTTMFAASKVFEIYADTLIFPTLHTYLHNCSLYPGDAPQRTTSKVKNNAIFWGLKAVLIFLNVGTASLFVSQRTRVVHAAASSTAATRHLQETMTDSADDRNGHGVFASLLHGHTHAFHALDDTACAAASSQWTPLDVDYSSVSFAFARRPWTEQLVRRFQSAPADASVSLSLERCMQDPTACKQTLAAGGIDGQDVATLLSQGAQNATLQAATAAFAQAVVSVVPDSIASEAMLTVERTAFDAGVGALSARVTVARRVSNDAVVCGSDHCVLVADAAPAPRVSVQLTASGFLTSATTRSAVTTPEGDLRELISYSFAKLSVPTASDGGMRVALDDGDSLIVSQRDRDAIATSPSAVLSVNSILLPDAASYKTWLPITNASPTVSTKCGESLVDAYVTHLSQNGLTLDQSSITATMATAAVLYATQEAAFAPSAAALAVERRLAGSSSAGNTVKLKLSIPEYSAIATFAGCVVMVLLTAFVVKRPAARVRLTPNTTPAAQYVQILTDDLYPNIVHKKRLRFVNGEVLPFNEYVVDSIVLQAKRDATKKIYLSA